MRRERQKAAATASRKKASQRKGDDNEEKKHTKKKSKKLSKTTTKDGEEVKKEKKEKKKDDSAVDGAKEGEDKKKKKSKKREIHVSKRHLEKIAIRKKQKGFGIEEGLQAQFAIPSCKILAKISSRPGQDGRANGYILEGEELAFYQRKLDKKKQKK